MSNVLTMNRERHCKHCGWPEPVHTESKNIKDKDLNAKNHFDRSYNECPGFEIDPDEVW